MRVLKLCGVGAILTVVAMGSSGPSGLAQGLLCNLELNKLTPPSHRERFPRSGYLFGCGAVA